MRKIIVEIGQKVYFDHFSEAAQGFGADLVRGNVVEGTVDYINRKGGWFSVVYGNLRTSFFFTEIGKKVFNEQRAARRSAKSV